MFAILVELHDGSIAPMNVFRFALDAENARDEFNKFYRDHTVIKYVSDQTMSPEMLERCKALPIIEPEHPRCCICEKFIPSTAAPVLKEKGFCSWHCMDDLYDFS